jgi:ATP-binding cassette subfamily B (MDR/TAP) protein 1
MATPNIKAVVEGQLAGKLAYDIINRAPKINNNDEKSKKLTNLSGRIEFKNVDFSYPTRQDQKVLNNFSAVFEQGKTTAIVGASGSGKSTIVQLIERFYDPASGEVLVDGHNLKDINLRDFRYKVGYVG